MKRIGAMGLALLLFVLLVMPAFALTGGEGRRIEIDLERDGSGNVEEISIESTCTTRDQVVEFEVEFDAKDAEIEIEYEVESGIREREAGVEIDFTRLIEYIDLDGDETFDEGEEINKFAICDLIFNNPAYRKISEEGVMGYEISCYMDLKGATQDKGKLSISLIVLEDSAEVNGTLIEPTWVKINIAIADFPFKEESSGLALEVAVESGVEMEYFQERDIDELKAKLQNIAEFFNWETTATVDGKIVNVLHDISDTRRNGEWDPDGNDFELENERIVYLSYPRGSCIVHDPIVGISAEGSPASGPLGLSMAWYVIGALVLVVAIVVGIGIHKKKK